MTDEVAFEALLRLYRKAFNRARDEITDAAIADGKLTGAEICIALAMAGINITALAILGGRLDIKDWEGELAKAVALKRETVEPGKRLQ
jgi:hypothetical protein